MPRRPLAWPPGWRRTSGGKGAAYRAARHRATGQLVGVNGSAGSVHPKVTGVAEFARDTSRDTNLRRLRGLMRPTEVEDLTPAAWSGALRSGPAHS